MLNGVLVNWSNQNTHTSRCNHFLPHLPPLSLPQGQVCTKCGSILSSLLDKPAVDVAAAAAHRERKWTCKTCENSEHIQLLAFPYVFRYLVAELAGMNIKVSLDVKRVGSE